MQIEKGVEMTKPKTGRGSGGEQTSWAMFADMEVGDSILADGEGASTKLCPALNSISQYGRRYGKKFSGRKQGNGKVRIWRVE